MNRVRQALVLVVSCCAVQVSPQAPAPSAPRGQAPPETDIYLASLSVVSGRLTIGPAENITNSKGYDNQPSFTPDGRAILFTSAREEAIRSPGASSTATQTDIYRYDIASRATSRITETPESEYSPQVEPDGAHIAVVRVEADGTQRLWRFTLDGRDPQLVLREVKPVGYHVSSDAHHVALFVLGDPPTLQVADPATSNAQVVARGIGRSLQRMPSGRISYVQREPGDAGPAVLTIMELDPAAGSVKPIARVMAGATEPYPVWTPDGTLLLANAGTLYQWRPAEGWVAVADLSKLGLRGATRLAVSPRGQWLAIVAQPR